MFIGVDVGSGSVRAAVFNEKGKMLGLSVKPIEIFRPQENFVEQSSEDIWSKACDAIKDALAAANIKAEQIKSIGFDATCSLVAVRDGFKPVSVSPTFIEQQNVIMWMDHRAIQEADEINNSGDHVLDYVGGKISPEMQVPKLLWLRRHLTSQYDHTDKFLDLADYMVYRSCGDDIRSVCTKTCKWTYLAHENKWSDAFFKKLDLLDLLEKTKVGRFIKDLGTPAGTLTQESALQMGLLPGITVAVGIIDAHAGGLGVIGSHPEETLALVGGTSSCHLAVNKKQIFVEGVWGPYYGALLPGYWLSEGGQSATGALIDHVIKQSAVYPVLQQTAADQKLSVYEVLNKSVYKQRAENPFFEQDTHILGYFHGNRSPRANPHLRGMISGLSLNTTIDELARFYLAAIQSVAYGTRHIIESMNIAGHQLKKINMCGGGTKNPLWLSEHADITGMEIALAVEPEAVLLGSAILAATACGHFADIFESMGNMAFNSQIIHPDDSRKDYHDKKYNVFLEMYNDQIKYKEMMK